MTPADEILAVLAEHLECRCDKLCVCGADSRAVHTMADEIVALRAERDALRALVESAYREGFYDGEDDAPIGELPAGYGDTAWWMSDARKALEVQP